MWDCVQLLEENSRNRAQKLYFVKDFMWSFNSILNTFQDELGKATHRLQEDLLEQTDSTLSTGMNGFVNQVEQLSDVIRTMAERVLAKEMTTKVDKFQTNYQNENRELLKKCDFMWLSFHMERQSMMLKKEDYSNHMFELEHLKLAVIKEPQLKFLESH